jgi:ferric-dicitrate binding protein FerR (iron transport regulator)
MDDTTPRDPRLAAALREAEGEPPLHEVDWEGMRQSVNARAELALARLRAASAPPAPDRKPAPHRRAMQWLVPLAAAAGVGGLLLARLPTSGPEHQVGHGPTVTQPAPAAGDASVDAILAASLPEHVDRAIDGRDDEDALVSGALGT